MALTGWLMWRLKRMEIGRVLIPCGISAAVFGTVFGSVFGFEHVLDPVYKGLFGLEEKPIEVMGTGTPIKIILAAVLLGIALILISMGINIYSSLRQKDYEQAFSGPTGRWFPVLRRDHGRGGVPAAAESSPCSRRCI